MRNTVQFTRLLLLLGVIAAAIGAGTGLAFAHGGQPEVKTVPAQVQPGGSFTVSGSDFEAGIAINITLENAAGVTNLGAVTADDGGVFTFQATAPVSAAAGSYTVRAATSDDTATADFSIAAGAAGESASGGHEVAMAPGGAAAPAAALTVVHQRTTAEDVLIGVIFGGLAVIGLVLVATSRRQGSRRAHQV